MPPRESGTFSNNEKTFLLDALRVGVRLDGRALDSFRPLELTFGDEYGAANVKFGRTKVSARVSAEVTVPFPDRKFEGLFSISTELSPMASPIFELGRSTVSETLLSRILEKTIRRSSALDVESLCLVAGMKCFHVRVDVHVLAHDGNILDASCVAVLAALRHFRRPDVTVEGENVTVWSPVEREPVKLSMLHHPFCVSFSYYDEGSVVLLDATLAEERVREGQLVVSANRYGEVCQIAKYGGATMNALEFVKTSKMALESAKILDSLVQNKLAEDDRSRDIGGLIAELSAEHER